MNKYELIVTIVNKDYSSNLMEAAREVGAKGGTILNARGAGGHEVEKEVPITSSTGIEKQIPRPGVFNPVAEIIDFIISSLYSTSVRIRTTSFSC